MSEQMRKEFEAWYSRRWPGRSANVAMHSALEADAWEVWEAAQGARQSRVRVDGIGELGIRLPLKVDGVTALENGVLGVVVELPKQIGEMKCWLHDCKTVEQCAESGCAQRLATQPQAPEPIAHLRFWAGQMISPDGNVEADDGLEVCPPHMVGADGVEAFPVWAHPPAIRIPEGWQLVPLLAPTTPEVRK